jgi:hypothetical protein
MSLIYFYYYYTQLAIIFFINSVPMCLLQEPNFILINNNINKKKYLYPYSLNDLSIYPISYSTLELDLYTTYITKMVDFQFNCSIIFIDFIYSKAVNNSIYLYNAFDKTFYYLFLNYFFFLKVFFQYCINILNIDIIFKQYVYVNSSLLNLFKTNFLFSVIIAYDEFIQEKNINTLQFFKNKFELVEYTACSLGTIHCISNFNYLKYYLKCLFVDKKLYSFGYFQFFRTVCFIAIHSWGLLMFVRKDIKHSGIFYYDMLFFFMNKVIFYFIEIILVNNMRWLLIIWCFIYISTYCLNSFTHIFNKEIKKKILYEFELVEYLDENYQLNWFSRLKPISIYSINTDWHFLIAYKFKQLPYSSKFGYIFGLLALGGCILYSRFPSKINLRFMGKFYYYQTIRYSLTCFFDFWSYLLKTRNRVGLSIFFGTTYEFFVCNDNQNILFLQYLFFFFFKKLHIFYIDNLLINFYHLSVQETFLFTNILKYTNILAFFYHYNLRFTYVEFLLYYNLLYNIDLFELNSVVVAESIILSLMTQSVSTNAIQQQNDYHDNIHAIVRVCNNAEQILSNAA